MAVNSRGNIRELYALFDHLGTTKMLTNNWGTVTWPHPVRNVNKLLPFGKDLDLYPNTPDPVQEAYKLTFTGKELDKTLGLHYFGARYYNATLPRFLSPDPVGGKPENPLSWNRYLYCFNDPINYFDPDGKFGIVAMVALAAASAIFTEIANAPETEADVVPAQGVLYTVGGPAFTIAIMTTGINIFDYGGDSDSEDVTVSRWGREGLESGDFVMRGTKNWLNYFKSGKWQRGGGNQKAPYDSGKEYVVPRDSVKPPSDAKNATFWDRGLFGLIKKWLGQACYQKEEGEEQ